MSGDNVNDASANHAVPSDMDRGGLDAVLGFHLSDSQWEAVSAPLAPGVIVAGAGTGKTTSMSARVAYLSAIGAVDPDRVLGLTFTNKAASALVAAIRSHVASVGFAEAEPSVFTYNAFASRVVTDYGLRIGHEPKATLLTDGLRYQHAYRMVCALHGDEVGEGLARMGRRPMDVTDLMLRLDSELSELAIEPHRVVEHDRALIAQLDVLGSGRGKAREIAEKAQDRIMLAVLIERWRDYKTTHDLWEYIDQVRLAQ
ncbi:MAG: UvrD-helicase domain-containing protein, partial [Candidatus Nanopelagicales bacterium]